MKPRFTFAASAAALSILALSAGAAETTTTGVDRQHPSNYDRTGARHSERLGQVAKASDLIGMSVQNLQNEKLGKVENLMVDLQNGRVVQVVISSGGFLGLGDELSAVPPAALHYDAGQKVLHLDVTKEALSQAPHFNSKQWPNLGDPDYSSSVYRAYKVNPYFDGKAADADNSKRNVQDRRSDRLTPFDQSSAKGDVDITREIRKELGEQKDFSVNARNVKIITADGRVTLRGPVNSDSEKTRIAEIAKRHAHGIQVDNQLEVKRD